MNVPILPVAITGSEKLRNLWWCFLHHPRITITIGKPFNLPPAEGKSTREQRQQMIDYIMRKIAALLPPEYRGVYAGGKNAGELKKPVRPASASGSGGPSTSWKK